MPESIAIAAAVTLLAIGFSAALYALWRRLRAQHAELERLRAEVEQARAEHQEFAYIVSHDLQEPIRAIEGFAELIEKRHGETLNDEAQEFMGFVSAGALRLREQISALLDYSRAATAPLDIRRVAIADVLDQIRVTFDKREETGELRLNGNATVVDADAQQLRYVLHHLIEAAVEMSEPGSQPAIDIRVEDEGASSRIAIQSSNINGIDKTQVERLFKPSLNPVREGDELSGMELAVCRRMVERHGGEVWIEPDSSGLGLFFTLPKRQH